MKQTFKKRRGFSLLEITLALAIAITIAAGGFTVYKKAQSSQRAEREARNIATIKAGVKSLYGGKSNYEGLVNQVAIEAHIIPDNMLVPGSMRQIVSSYGGQVTVYASDYGITKGPNSSFTIIYAGVPDEDCVKLVPPVVGDLSAAKVNNTRVKEIGGVLDLDALTTACSEGKNKNQINLSTL